MNNFVTYKTSNWKWKIVDAFNLNISFILFDLNYSGEACPQERIVIHSRLIKFIGQYCGRRYYWSVFASSAPITLEFYTYQVSTSEFALKYQIANTILKTLLHKYNYFKDKNTAENITSIHPFSWNHIYFLKNIAHCSWNIIIPKIYQLLIKVLNIFSVKNSIIIYDGPDFNNKPFGLNIEEFFAASSFQVLILHHNPKNKQIEMTFTNDIRKEKVEMHHHKYKINDKRKLHSKKFPCEQLTTVLCISKLYAPKNYFVNITLLSVKYSGPNVGYCKYGGLSMYDYVNNDMKEILLLCDNVFPVTLNNQPQQTIVSSIQSIFLIFYAYWPYSKIELYITIEPMPCKGVHVLR